MIYMFKEKLYHELTYLKTLEIYGLHPAHFLSTSRLAWQAVLKKDKSKIRLITYINMLSMVEKYITGEIWYAIY